MDRKEIRRYKLYAAILLAIIFASSLIYHQLGGFDKLVVNTVGKCSFRLAGLKVDESISRDAIKSTFQDLKAATEKGTLKGCKLSVLSYPQSEDNSQFMGLILASDTQSVSADYHITELSYTHTYRVDLKMNILVMPDKKKVEEEIESYARKDGVTIDQVFLEVYNHDNSITIYGFGNDI